jgi:glyoxylase-like metal-dependent hydrolase (beta-lactamase superfamily II)
MKKNRYSEEQTASALRQAETRRTCYGRKLVLVVATVLGLGGVALAQQPLQPQQSQPMTVHPLREGAVYWISGGGGNSGVIIGQHSVIIVDAKTTREAGEQLIAEVAKLTPKPITHVIITHSDCDHVNGLAGFPDGLTIIAHVNEKQEQEAAFAAGGRGMPPPNRLPTQVVMQDTESMTIDGAHFILLHWAPAHTSGDLAVYLPDERTVFTGDILTTLILIHPDKSGTLDGWFKTARGLLALDADTYVPGHGSTVESKAGIQKRIDDNQAKRDKIATMMKEGKSLDSIKTAMGDPLGPGPSGCRGIPFPSFTETEYRFQSSKSQVPE